MKICVVNKSGGVGARFLSRLGRRFEHCVPASRMRHFKKGRGALAVTVTYVGVRTILALNTQFRKKRRPTDVLTFEADSAEYPYLGEIVICPAVAAENATRLKRPRSRELALLFVHGLLHLVGYDHATPAEKKVMWKLQERILAR